MPKMLRDINMPVNGRRDSTDPYVGVLASEIPSGFLLPAFLLNDVDEIEPNRLYSFEILTPPAQGTLTLDKKGVGTFVGPTGTYTGTQRVKKFDPGVGLMYSADTTYSFNVTDGVVSSVSGVTVSPLTATGSQQFSATVQGTNVPSQAVTWTTTGGTINSSGAFTAPAPTSAVQVVTVRATSVSDTSKFAEATITIAAAVVGGGGSGATAAEIAAAVWSAQTALSIPQFLALK